MYSHIKVITIFLMLCSYVLKKENPKNSKNHQSYGRFKSLSNFIIILNISITTVIPPIDYHSIWQASEITITVRLTSNSLRQDDCVT